MPGPQPIPQLTPQLPEELRAVARLAALSGDMVTVITDDQTTVFMSDASARFLGLDAQAEVGKKSTLPPLHPDDLPRLLATRERRLRSGESLEVRVRRADGAWRWLELRSFPMAANGLRHIITLLRDIQARKDVEESIQRTNQALESNSDASGDGVLVVDPEGRIVSWNRRLPDLLEIPEAVLQLGAVAEASQALYDNLVDPDAYLRAAAAPAVEATQTLRLELRSGRVLERTRILPGLRPGLPRPDAVLLYRDVTTQVRSERELQGSFEALRRSRESFRALIEEAPDLILVHRAGLIVYGNAVARELTGVKTVAELVGRPLASLAHPDDRAELERRVSEPEPPGRRGAPLPIRMTSPEGAERVHEMVSLPTSFEGEPAILTFGRDLTERHELQLRLQLADRMVSVGTLAAGVAHELNNPLAYVMANLQFLGDELRAFGPVVEQTPLGPRLRHAEESLREAYEGASRLRVIVRDLSTFSRGEGDNRGPIDLRPVVESSLNMAQHQIRHRATVVRDLQPVPKVLGSAARLGQVALNLLVNAAQAIPEGNAAENQISIRTRLEGGLVCFEVKDSGAGIPPQLLGRIFDPFFTTKAPGIGTGLGLSICHSIITSMGGSIEVESAPGQGTTFRVLLPPTADVPAAAPKPAAPKAAARGRLLVIDDEPLVGLALKRALQREHDVTVLQSGRVALERLRAGEQYDALVSDLLMPDCTGMELYEELCTLSPRLAERTLFLTGGAFTEGAREFLERPAIRSMEKPFDVDLLRAAVRELVDGK